MEIENTIKGLFYYNKQKHLLLKEYGRNVQNMADELFNIEDIEIRTIAAQDIIRIMTFLSTLKDTLDFQKRLWEHLYIMTDYKLKFNGPYEEPIPKSNIKENRPAYYPFKAKFKQYGTNVQLMIAKAAEMEPSDDRDSYLSQIANIMKLNIQKTVANDAIHDFAVLEHLKELSKNKLSINNENIILKTSEQLKTNKSISNVSPVPNNRKTLNFRGKTNFTKTKSQNQSNFKKKN